MNVFKLSKITEKIWLILAIMALLYGGYKFYESGFNHARQFLIVGIICLLVFGVKYAFRKKVEGKEHH